MPLSGVLSGHDERLWSCGMVSVAASRLWREL